MSSFRLPVSNRNSKPQGFLNVLFKQLFCRLRYSTFGDEELAEKLNKFVVAIADKKVTVRDLLRTLKNSKEYLPNDTKSYRKLTDDSMWLFEYILSHIQE